MNRDRKQLPVIIGHLEDGESDKCTVVFQEDSHAKVLICRLKDSAERHCGDEVAAQEIQSVISEMWFCRKESLQAYINVLQGVLDKWKEETECEK